MQRPITSLLVLVLVSLANVAWAQTAQTGWAVWSSTLNTSSAAGIVDGVPFTLTLNPVGNASANGGGLYLNLNGYNPASSEFATTGSYGPGAPAKTSCVTLNYFAAGANSNLNKYFNVTLQFSSPVYNPRVCVKNLDASFIEFYTTPSTLLYTNGELTKTNDRYFDPDGDGNDPNPGGDGTIAFVGAYTSISFWARTLSGSNDGYKLTVTGSSEARYWAVWNSTFTASSASGTVNNVPFTLTLNPAGNTSGGLIVQGYNSPDGADGDVFADAVSFGPGAPAKTSSLGMLYYGNAANSGLTEYFNVTLQFASAVWNPRICIQNIDASFIQFYTTPSTLLYTNGELVQLVYTDGETVKYGDKYYDRDGTAASPLIGGGDGTIAFTGEYTSISFWAGKTDDANDGYKLTVTVSDSSPTPAPTQVPTQQPTQQPTKTPTQAPTYAVPPTDSPVEPLPQYQNTVCEPELTLVRRQRQLSSTGRDGGHDRVLLQEYTPQTCYEACVARLGFPPNGFVLNLYYNENGEQVCTCCRECEGVRYVPGAQLYAVCSAETSGGLELGATAKPMRRVRAGNILRYTVTIRSAAKQAKTKTKAAGPTLNLRVALPAGVHYVRSSTRPWLLMRSSWGGQREIEPVLTDNGALLTWEDIGATRKIKVKVHVGSNIAAGTPLTFSAQLYESVQVGSNVAPACAQSAPNVTVMVI